MIKLVLLRHGESHWNLENRFTGWTDVDLTPKGIEEAREAARLLREGGYTFDVAHTSLLKRAIRTLWITLDGMDLMWIPGPPELAAQRAPLRRPPGARTRRRPPRSTATSRCWSGAAATPIPPPPLTPDDPRYPGHDRRYAGLSPAELPLAESLKDTVARFLPYWHETIVPDLQAGRRVLIAAHGNSLRALVKHLDGISEEEIVGLNIPTGIPLVYELDDAEMDRRHYRGSSASPRKAAEAVRNRPRPGNLPERAALQESRRSLPPGFARTGSRRRSRCWSSWASSANSDSPHWTGRGSLRRS